jgi:DNA-binding FadR family transcriptional regulator
MRLAFSSYHLMNKRRNTVRPKNLHGQVTEAIGRAILRGEYPPGATLPTEDALAARYDVSRAVLREAMKSLAAKGMVSIRPRAGTRILPRESWQILDAELLDWHAGGPIEPGFVTDLLDLRRMIEPQAARLAAERATPADVAAMRAAFQRMGAALEGQGDYVAADMAFHAALLAAAQNRFLHQLGGALERLLTFSTNISWKYPDAARGSLPLHGALLEAVERRDPEAAAAQITRLIDRHEIHLRGMLRGDVPQAPQGAGEAKGGNA